MKGVNHLKVFGIIVIIFMTLITVGYTMNQETRNPLPERLIKDGMTAIQTGYTGIVDSVKGFLTNVNDLFHTYEENKLLKQQMYIMKLRGICSSIRRTNQFVRRVTGNGCFFNELYDNQCLNCDA